MTPSKKERTEAGQSPQQKLDKALGWYNSIQEKSSRLQELQVWHATLPLGELTVTVGPQSLLAAAEAEIKNGQPGFWTEDSDACGWFAAVDGIIIERVKRDVGQQKTISIAPETIGNYAPKVLKVHVQLTLRKIPTLIVAHYKQESFLLEPPADTLGAKRAAKMHKSKFWAFWYPLVGGMGRSGWAITVLVLGPIVSKYLDRFVDWLLGLLPDWNIDLPDLHIPWPQINWPDIHIPWPDWHLPDINLPDWHLPSWLVAILDFLAEYDKIWLPLVAALIFGLSTARQVKKSEQRKAAQGKPKPELAAETPLAENDLATKKEQEEKDKGAS